MTAHDHPTAPIASRVATWVTAMIAVLVVVFPVVFGVAFPYSLAAFEVTAFLLFIVAAFWLQLPARSLLVVLWLCLGFVLHVLVLDGDLGALAFRGSCLADGPHPSGIDTVAAFDSFRRGLAYVLVFLMVRHVSASARNASVLFSAVAASAAVLLVLGVVAPQDSKNILWFHAVPTHDRDWLSSSVNSLLTDFWGYARTYEHNGIPVTLDELQVSRKPVGPIFNGNQYAAAIGVSFPVLLAWLGERLARRSRIRPGYALLPFAVLTSVVVYLLTDSRGGLLAMSVSLAGFFVIRRNGRLIVPFTALVILCAVAICVFVPLLRASGEIPLLGGRATIWLQTVRVFLEQPLFGIGIGNFADLRLGYGNAPPVVWYAAHNVFLQFLVEVGVAGLVWLGIAAWLVAGNTRARPAVPGPDVRAGLIASLLFVIMHGAVDYSAGMPYVAAIVAIAAGLLLGPPAVTHTATALRRPRAGRLVAQATAWLAAVLLAMSSIRYGVSQDRLYSIKEWTAVALARTGDGESAMSRLTQLMLSTEHGCRVLPPRRDSFLSQAHAHVLLASSRDTEHLDWAAEFLAQYQSIGRRDDSRSLTQDRIAADLADPGAEPPLNP